MASDLDILEQAIAWRAAGHGVVLVSVVATWGSSPRPVGSQMAVNDAREFVGSVSGGCVESATIGEALKVMHQGLPHTLEYSVGNERAWDVGLTCGGTVRMLLVPILEAELLSLVCELITSRIPTALITDCVGGSQAVYEPNLVTAGVVLPEQCLPEISEMLAADSSGTLAGQASALFCRSYKPAPRLVVVGAVHIAQILVPMASMAGFDVRIVDPRRAFATDARFPQATLYADWPEKYFEKEPADQSTAVVLLSHDPKIDDPALIAALDSQAFYVGALGSRVTHAQRLQRLRECGVDENSLNRIHAPIGLDLGGRKPAEIAVAILAEVIGNRNRPGAPR